MIYTLTNLFIIRFIYFAVKHLDNILHYDMFAMYTIRRLIIMRKQRELKYSLSRTNDVRWIQSSLYQSYYIGFHTHLLESSQ